MTSLEIQDILYRKLTTIAAEQGMSIQQMLEKFVSQQEQIRREHDLENQRRKAVQRGELISNEEMMKWLDETLEERKTG